MRKRLYRIKTYLRRLLSSRLFTNFSHTYPLLSAFGYRSIAHHTYDQFSTCNPKNIREGHIIYVKNDLIQDFFDYIHPHITSKYILLSHGDDARIDNRFLSYLENEKIIHWYALNLDFVHPKATVIPLGVQNFNVHFPENFIESYISIAPTLISVQKKTEIIFGFTITAHNQERKDAFHFLSSSPLAKEVKLPRTEYYQHLAGVKFIASPQGNGLDCHRIWEALYFKTIPILVRSTFSLELQKEGYPIYIIEDWSEIERLDIQILDKFYLQYQNLFNTPKLYLHYWQELLRPTFVR